MTCIVVTGASSGIGAALVRLLSEHHPVVGLDRHAAPGSPVIGCDLTDPASVAAALARLPDRIGGLANVAGVAGTAPATRVMEVNLLGTRRITEALAGRIADGGAIVTVASLAGHHPGFDDDVRRLLAADDDDVLAWTRTAGLSGAQAYDVSKKALLRYGRQLSARLAPRRVRSCTVSPGPVETPLLPEFEASMAGAVERAATWTGRHARPEEIARVVAFLLSPDASWISGVDVVADGGLTARRADDARP
ncbi:SDR family oxidoreductase [Xylanimonas allomyrinae]|uniref:SDR family oxidoreductase n=1 Tax=Xylanimonas allomyrinae TaxID=2509459 RepID=A0A4V0YDY1_9MICO|nr:SDR family oxidoreductase [Xylanimonas allomyrinae]QAY62291.1 SDR family oxidoreductase [Xylanimonas allomyrinae]